MPKSQSNLFRISKVHVIRWIIPIAYVIVFTVSHIYLISHPQDKSKKNYFPKEERFRTLCFHQSNGHEGPTCGLTTSYRFFLEGRLADSVIRQPFGMVSLFLGFGLYILMFLVILRGESYYVKAYDFARRTRVFQIVLILFLTGWIYNLIRHLILHYY